jgi:plastocyanin
MRRMIVSTTVVLLALLVVGVIPIAAAASGGGGCGRPVSDARGSRVRIVSFCFLPTILRIRPGEAVTFKNRDGFAHTVLGANAVWGSFSEVRSHRTVTYRFTRPGVYPYVCTYHPGMVGAVIVGNGSAHGEATAAVTAAGPVVAVDSAMRRAPVSTTNAVPTAPVSSSNRIARWQMLLLASLLVAAFALVAIERRRARRIAT